MIEYNKRLVEVSIILNHLKKSDYDKIPKEVIDRIERNKDIEYVWYYDETKDLKNQKVSKDTIAILSYINMKYLLNEEQRKFVEEVFKENQKKIENMKREKFNQDNLFKNKIDTSKTSKLSVIKYKESFFTKIKKWLSYWIMVLNKKMY